MTMANAPRGRLNQKAQRQPMLSANQPPKMGPSTEENAQAPPMMPMYLPRCRGGTMSAIMDIERIISPPPPRPCMPRAAMSTGMLCASPPSTEPPKKSVRPLKKSTLWPKRSPSLP